jgi:16S rRNA (adenine1518-N6/adenine1519-N6)-dimethyltransferase
VNRPKKSLGQNFLIDPNVARKIVRSLELRKSDHVLEIGPGKGALTALLLAELSTITAVEIDDQLAAELQATHGNALTLYHDDVLNLDPRFIAKEKGGKLRIVGNIPYNITSPILFWAIDSSDAIADCTLMMQHEVAQRLVAKPRSVLLSTGIKIHCFARFILPRTGGDVRSGIARFRTAASFASC